jgi:glyoxylase-like metal-dependent hydrolase (beta-lactamase superfamily II)
MTTLFALLLALFPSFQAAPAMAPKTPEYTIQAIRFGTIPQFRTSGLVIGADPNEKLDIATIVWLIRGGGRTILFDTGYHRQKPGFTNFGTIDFVSPDEAVKLAGVQPDQVTDLIVSHIHWDHMGGIDLFPKATIWIQKDEYQYYMGPAYQAGGKRGGELEDLQELLRRNVSCAAPNAGGGGGGGRGGAAAGGAAPAAAAPAAPAAPQCGKVVLIDGDDREIIPGISVYTGARHTYASQYIRVLGTPTFVLASDNVYLYRNIDTKAPIATFDPVDRFANVAAFDRMIRLAGDKSRVLPGHDMLIFSRFPTEGRIAKIK